MSNTHDADIERDSFSELVAHRGRHRSEMLERLAAEIEQPPQTGPLLEPDGIDIIAHEIRKLRYGQMMKFATEWLQHLPPKVAESLTIHDLAMSLNTWAEGGGTPK